MVDQGGRIVMTNGIMRTATLPYVVLIFLGTSAVFGLSRNDYRRPYEGEAHTTGIIHNHLQNPWTFDPRHRPPVSLDSNTLEPGTINPEIFYSPWTFDPRPRPPVASDPDTSGTLEAKVYYPDPRKLEFAPGSGFILPQTSVHMWIQGGNLCNQAIVATIECVGKIEHVILETPLQHIRDIRIPNRIVQVAMSLARDTIPLLSQTKRFLAQFFTTIFELPAKALYGTMSIFYDLLTKLQAWGYDCHQQQQDRGVCSVPPPNIGGFGPCAGSWPCLRAVACRTAPCLANTRKFLHLLPHGWEASKSGRK